MEGIQSSSALSASRSFFTPLLISMAGIVSTAIVISIYHLVLVKYYRWRREISSRISQQIDAGGQLGIGVDKNILETIPILAYSTKKGAMFRVDQSECVVCLGELEDGDMVRLLPNCRHAFHITCIDEWFLAHSNCPVCRSPIVAPATVVVPLLVGNEEGDGAERTPRVHDHGGDRVDLNSPMKSSGLLRHCVSLALPLEEKPKDLVAGLKRSLSMDQSLVLLNIQRKSESVSSSSSSSSSSSYSSSTKDGITGSGSYREQSMRKLDMLLRSFPRLKMGRSSMTDGILPY